MRGCSRAALAVVLLASAHRHTEAGSPPVHGEKARGGPAGVDAAAQETDRLLASMEIEVGLRSSNALTLADTATTGPWGGGGGRAAAAHRKQPTALHRTPHPDRPCTCRVACPCRLFSSVPKSAGNSAGDGDKKTWLGSWAVRVDPAAVSRATLDALAERHGLVVIGTVGGLGDTFFLHRRCREDDNTHCRQRRDEGSTLSIAAHPGVLEGTRHPATPPIPPHAVLI